MLETRNWISLEDVDDLLDSAYNPNNIVHEFVTVNGLNFEFPATLHALLVVPLLAPKTIVVPTGYDRNRVVELVAEGALNLWDDAVVELL
jgi:hypothetical protein